MRFGLALALTVVFGCAQVEDADGAEGAGIAGAAGAAVGASGAGGAAASGGDPALGAGSGVAGAASAEAGTRAMRFEGGAGGPAVDPCAEPIEGMAQPGCACEPGTAPSSCDPPDIRVVQKGLSGTLTCSEGIAYCRRGTWSPCEVLLQYASFVPD